MPKKLQFFLDQFLQISKTMKTKPFLTLLLLTLAFSVNAQRSDLIVGNWVFKDALNKEIDEAGRAYIEAEVIDKWKFSFHPNGLFETSMMGEKETGEWKLSSDSKGIILVGMEGEPTEFKILKATEKELTLKLGLGEFVLRRINEN